MTLVNTETGEIVESLTADQARVLTDRIRLLGDSVADQLDKMADLIDKARVGSAWSALGYRSWPEYVSTEFKGLLPRLDREPRQEFVRELASRGMSTRAIAPVLGVSKDTVARDLSPVSDETPQTPAPTSEGEADEGAGQASEGRPVAPVPPSPEGGASPALPREAKVGNGSPAPRPPVTGIDGKTYAAPAPKPPKPVLDGAAAEYDNAEQAAKSLARAISKLLEFQHPNMREGMRRYWSMASVEVPPTPRRDVTPEQMRVAAQGLLTLADEWDAS